MLERFRIVKKGYDPVDVEEHISNLESVIRRYREKDSAINNAIVSAQYAADEILRKARIAEEDIIKNARNQSVEIKSKSAAHVQSILNLVQTQKSLFKDFAYEYNALAQKYLQSVNDNDFASVTDKFDALERYLNTFTSEQEAFDPVVEPPQANPTNLTPTAANAVPLSIQEKEALDASFGNNAATDSDDDMKQLLS